MNINKKYITIGGGIAAAIAVALIVGWPIFEDRGLVKYRDPNLTSEIRAIYEQRLNEAKQQVADSKNNNDDQLFIAYLDLARAQASLGELADSRASYKKAINTGASETFLVANAWYEMSVVLDSMGDKDGAKMALDKAIELDPANETFINAKNRSQE